MGKPGLLQPMGSQRVGHDLVTEWEQQQKPIQHCKDTRHLCLLSCAGLFVTPWTVAHQAILSMEFSKQEYWSDLPVPIPGDLPNPEVKPGNPYQLHHLGKQKATLLQ